MATETPKYREAEAMLPEELKPVFAKLVKEYEFLTGLHYGQGYVAYKVLADLVLAGWRTSAPPDAKSKI